MSNEMKSRVFVDFPSQERDLLENLCDQDFRPPAEQIRFLIMSEATRRGLVSKTQNAASGHIRQDLATSSVL